MRVRVTDGAQRVIDLAAGAAHHDGIAGFGADYVFLGLAHYREVLPGVNRVATVVLDELNVSLNEFAQSFGPRKPEVATPPKVKPSAEFMDAAYAETKDLPISSDCADVVGTEHLLLAIGSSDAKAAEYLRNAGVDCDKLRQVTMQAVGIQKPNEGQPT